MTSSNHKGDTPGKRINRYLVWAQHQSLLQSRFLTVPHAFLASRHAGDIGCLDQFAVLRSQMWAVDKDPNQYRELGEKAANLGFQLFTRPIEQVAANHPLSSVYLDYCGNLNGSRRSISQVVRHLPPHSVVSVTLFIGREQDKLDSLEAREKPLRELMRAKHGASLAQFVYYHSDDDGVHGSPMGTWTFYLGQLPSRGKMKFDLTRYELAELRGN